MTQRCLECSSNMRVRRETISGEKALGLPGVYVRTSVARCPKCDATEVIFPNIEGLHQALARSIVAKAERLSGAEVRFLRKVLGWSGADFAQHMGTAAETISRWEHESTPIGPQADRLLRLMVMAVDPVADYRRLDLLKEVAKAKPAKVQVIAKANAESRAVRVANCAPDEWPEIKMARLSAP